MIRYEIMNTFDKPITYKEFTFYPITMLDFYEFSSYSDCFLVEKDFIPNEYKTSKEKMLEYVKIMQLNDLDFMYHTFNTRNMYVPKFNEILKLATKNPEMELLYGKDALGKAIFSFSGTDKIYDNDDYLQIREIISMQNDLELIDFRKSKAVRDAENTANEYRRKKSQMGDLEDLMISLSVYTGWSMQEIYNMSIRKFNKAISRADMRLHYEIYLGASMSGMVEFKDKSFIKHWLSSNEKQNNGFIELEQVSSKISNSGGK